jgi:hypothetical protein
MIHRGMKILTLLLSQNGRGKGKPSSAEDGS